MQSLEQGYKGLQRATYLYPKIMLKKIKTHSTAQKYQLNRTANLDKSRPFKQALNINNNNSATSSSEALAAVGWGRRTCKLG